MKKIKLYLLPLITALLLLTSCEDRFPINNYVIGDGEAKVTATVSFQPLMEALGEESRATAGNVMSTVDNMAVAIYDSEQSLIKLYNLSAGDFTKVEDNTDHPTDWNENDVPAEAKTARYTFSLPEPLKFGKYYMYVAANVGTITEEQAETPEKLRNIEVSWNSENVAANKQMFGYFVTGDNGASSPVTPEGSEYPVYAAPQIVINTPQTNLHAWVRRLASKVTICFNGSQLKENVFIYIHKVTIKQIAPKARLGNTAPLAGTTVADTLNYLDGASIYYSHSKGPSDKDEHPDVGQYLNWLEINKNSGISGAVTKNDNDTKTHSESDLALFFYENMQGDYADAPDKNKYDKKQDPKATGIFSKPGVDDYKDNVPCGTYIEVEGYYINNNPSELTNGEIKYRFMLGQDVDYNYNCERNQHYKLTMNFIGSANQVDWHIEYVEEKPETFAPPQFFVPYIYNRRVELPVRLVGNPVRVTVQIVENNWAPYDSTKTDSVPEATLGSLLGNGIHKFAWNKAVYENKSWLNWTGAAPPPTYNGLTGSYYGLRAGQDFGLFTKDKVAKFVKAGEPALPDEVTDDKIYKNNPYFTGGRDITPIWAGFLALQAPTGYTGANQTLPAGIINTPDIDFYSKQETVEAMRSYFIGEGGSVEKNSIPQHMVVYGDGKNIVNTVYDAGTQNECKITPNPDGKSRTMYIPLFTRPKAIGYISGFSGNNPYEYFPRKATLRITSEYITTGNARKVVVNEVRVIQERRIVNPKAIWRSAGNNQSFHVVLKLQPSPTTESFSPVVSKGEWEAYITAGNGSDDPVSNPYFSVSGGEWQRDNKVGGSTGSVIDFTVNFPGTVSKDNPQFAKLMVKYHSGSCSHLIFLRRGIEQPIAIIDGEAKWSSYSVYSLNKNTTTNAVTGTLTDSPMAMGSFFRLNNYNQGILASNNINYGVLVPINNVSLNLANGETATWNNCKGTTWKRGDALITWSDFTVGTTRYRLPEYNDFNAFVKTENNCYMAYGVLYGDESDTVADNELEAFRFGHKEGAKVGKGMRGVVVYNVNSNRNIFFPVGAFAVGRRTNSNVGNDNNKGYLRYGAVPAELIADWTPPTNSNPLAYNQYRPICYNLPASPGALYWIKTQAKNNFGQDNYVAWDMNYFDMSFNGQDYGATNQDGGDAMPMKPILAE